MPWKSVWEQECEATDPLAQYSGEGWFRKFARLREKALTMLAENTGEGAAFVCIGRDWEGIVEAMQGSKSRWRLDVFSKPERPIGFETEGVKAVGCKGGGKKKATAKRGK